MNCFPEEELCLRISETLRSWWSSLTGPIGALGKSRDIQGSVQSFVVSPFPITLPIFSLIRFFPMIMPFQPCEAEEVFWQSRKLLSCLYFPRRTQDSRQDGSLRIRQLTLARSPSLKFYERKREDQLTALCLIRSTIEVNKSFFFLLKSSGKPRILASS